MRKKTCYVLLLLSIMCLCFSFGCVVDNGSESSDSSTSVELEKSITLDINSISLDIYERITLTASTENTSGDIVWTSLDPTIATVENGTVVAKKVGSTTVKAEVDGVNAECSVYVADSGEKPIIEISEEDEINLYKGDEYTLDFEVKYKSLLFTYGEIELTSSESGMLTIEDKKITAVDTGTTELTISVKYNGVVAVSETVTVNVIEDINIGFNFEGDTIILAIDPINTDKYMEEFTVVPSVKKDNVIVEGAEVAYVIVDDSICSLSASKITALKLGETKVTVKYSSNGKDYTRDIIVKVVKERVEISKKFAIKSGTAFDVSALGISAADVVAATDETITSEAVEYTADGANLILTTTNVGERNYLLSTAEKDYVLNATVATTLISSPADFTAFMARSASVAANEYILFTEDIDMAGASCNNTKWLSGVVDGGGHIVKNFKSYSALRSNSGGCIVKNLGLIYTKTEWVVQYPAVIIAGQAAAMKLENVFVNVNLERCDYDVALLGNSINNATEVKNCVFVVTLSGDKNGGAYLDYAVSAAVTPLISDYYVISKDTLKKQQEYDGLTYVDNVSGIPETIGGLFEKNSDGLYFGGKMVICDSDEISVYRNFDTEIPLTDINAELEGKTVTKVSMLYGNDFVFTQDSGKLCFNTEAFSSFAENYQFVMRITTTEKDYYVNIKIGAKTYEKVEIESEPVCLVAADCSVDPATYGITDEVEFVFVKKSDKVLNYALEDGKVNMTSVLDSGNQTLVLQTADKQYELKVVFATQLISTAEEFKAYITSAKDARGYVTITQDIDMGGIDLLAYDAVNKKWLTYTGGTLDGNGHKISNFTSYNLFGHFVDGATTIWTLKNISLDFTATYWCEAYNGIIGGGKLYWSVMENVYMDIKVTRNTAVQGLFSAGVKGLQATNCVFKLTFIGEGDGAFYADYSDVGTYGNSSTQSTISNVYIITTEALTQHSEFGWDKLTIVSTADAITTIGGAFEKKADGIYYNGEIITCFGEPISAYNNHQSEIALTDINAALSDKTVTSVSIVGKGEVEFTQEDGKLVFGLAAFSKLDIGAIYILKVKTNDSEYNVNISATSFNSPIEKIEGVKYSDQATFTVNAAELGITDTVQLAFLKGTTTFFDVDSNVVDINTALELGKEKTLVLQTAEKQYELTLVYATVIIEDAEDFTAYIKGEKDAHGYAVITSDIDMAGVELNSVDGSSLRKYSGGTLDGRGHIVSNFTSYNLFGHSVEGAATIMYIINLGLDFDATYWCAAYNGIISSGRFNWSVMENVWMNINVARNNEVQALFGTCVNGLNAKNCVINLTFSGEGTGAFYADYSASGTYPTVSNSSTILNAYVISAETLSTHTENGWDKLTVLTTAEDITTIGVAFEKKADGLYYYGKKVIRFGVEKSVYNNNLSEIALTDINAELADKTVTELNITGKGEVAFTQEDGKLKFGITAFTMLDSGEYYILNIKTADGEYFVNLHAVAYDFEVEQIANVKYSTQKTFTLDVAELGISDIVKFAYLKGTTSLFAIDNNVVNINTELEMGKENTLVLQTENKQYELKIICATQFISNADEYRAYITSNKDANAYVLLTADIDMGGSELLSYNPVTRKWLTYNGGTLDGNGHKVSNFSSYDLFGHFVVGAATIWTLKNISFDFTATYWCENYSGIIGGGTLYWTKMENVYMNIKVTRNAAVQGLFGAGVKGLQATNCVFNLTFIGEGDGAFYADYSGVGAYNDSSSSSTLNNVYVITNETLARHSDYGWDALSVVSSINDITTIGGSFTKTAQGLFYNNEIVISSSAPIGVYNNNTSSIDITEIDSNLAGQTITALEVDGAVALNFTQSEDNLNFAIDAFREFDPITYHIVKVTTASGTYYFNLSISSYAFPVEEISGVRYTTNSAFDITASEYEITDVVNLAFIKGTNNFLTVSENVINLSGLTLGAEITLVMQTGSKQYELKVFYATKLISDAAAFKAHFSDGNTTTTTADYIVITKDIDLDGIQVYTSKSKRGTLDGRGNTVSNFYSECLFGVSTTLNMVVKNINLSYTKKHWTPTYCGIFVSSAGTMRIENSYINLNIDLTGVDYDLGLISKTVSGAYTMKNVVVNITVTGSNEKSIYADSASSSSGANIDNMYVITNGNTIKTWTTYEGLHLVENASGITTIGGSFEQKVDGLYFYDKKVL